MAGGLTRADVERYVAALTPAERAKLERELDAEEKDPRTHPAARSSTAAVVWRDPKVRPLPWQAQLGAVCDRLVDSALEGTGARITLAAPPRHGKPVAVTATVLMGDGSRRALGNVVVGDTVITHEGRARSVLAVHEQGDLPVVEIITDSGRTVRTALDHPFLTPSGWTDAGDLRAGDTLGMVAAPHVEPSPATRADAEFLMAGLFVGDGSVGHYGYALNCTITCADDTLGMVIEDACAALGWSVHRAPTGTKATNYGISGGSREWLRAIGMAGQTSHTKRVPAFVFAAPARQVAIFLGAYFACDGNINQRGKSRDDACAEFYSVNRALLADVQHLLLRLGVRSGLRAKKGKYNRRPHESWRLGITSQDDIARLAARMPIPGVKAATLAAWCQRRTAFDSPLLPDRVVSVEMLPPEPCRCLTVDEDETFTVEDLVVHNSTWTGLGVPIRAFVAGAGRGVAFSVLYVTSTSPRADEVSARVRAAVERLHRETGHEAFAPGLIWTRTEWETKGGLRWTGMGWSGATGGIGANLLILDDVIGTSQVYRSASTRAQIRRVVQEDMLSRLVNGGAALQMETRRGMDDTTAWLLREWPGTWEEHVWRCYDPERGYLWPSQYGEAWRATMPHLTDSSSVWRALYQQEPVPEGGTLIPLEWATATYPESPEMARRHADLVVIGCDLTTTAKKTSDAAAFVVVAKRGAYRDVLAVVRRHCGYVEQRQILRDLCSTWKPNAVIVERAAGGDAMVDELAGEIPGLRGEPPRGDKVTRLTPHLPRFAALQVRTPATPERWVGPWREEVTAFAGIDGEQDDQLDATVWALEGAEELRMPVLRFGGLRGR